jgi:phosphoglycolate phosphatase
MAQNRLSDTLVLFDWNGTLVDDTARALRAANRVLTARGRGALSPPQFSEQFKLPLHSMFSDLGVPPRDLLDAVDQFNAYLERNPAPMKAGVSQMLRSIRHRGAYTGVVSAASLGAVRADMNRLGIDEGWDVVETGAVDKAHALRSHRGARERAIYVGDTTYDMECAIQAGYVAVGVADGYSNPDALLVAGAQQVLSTVSALTAFL